MPAQDRSGLSVEALAEDATGYAPIVPPSVRDERADVILTASPLPSAWLSAVARIRWPEGDARDRVTEVRNHFRLAGAREFSWWLGPSTTPTDLRDQLMALGAAPDATGENATAMVLDRDPDGDVPDDVAVRMVTTFDDFREMQEILMEIDDITAADHRAALLAGLDERWASYRACGRIGFLADVDGSPAAAGQLAMLDDRRAFLSGGATRPWARGRGCYRALVVARWQLMREQGVEAFVVQASDMSAPILSRLGFRTTAMLHVLVDRSTTPVPTT